MSEKPSRLHDLMASRVAKKQNRAERGQMGLRIEKGERVPEPGDTISMSSTLTGMNYAVTIHKIIERRIHPDDGATLLTVQATKRPIIVNAKGVV